MKNVMAVPSGRRSFSLSEDEQLLIHGALAETLEERQQPYTQKQLAQLCRLHRRLNRVFGFDQDYAFRDGRVVLVRDSDQVVASSSSRSRVVRFSASGGAPATGARSPAPEALDMSRLPAGDA